MFLTAKHLEGCSDKTIRYYRCNIEKMLDTINIPIVNSLIYIVSNLVLLTLVIFLLTFFYDHIHDLLSMARTNKKSNNK